ncbi:PucR family transcriptional regulator [Sporosarcina ureilytica]|uniref:PucR family transcriptional regulator n=1 Tax=Sporosarcina ureilytica TaxID=298596 RepID=A0A1D8JH36_9BACL|nr:PucR family transcriptional regulator [Sporosarcina ureilytica]AOV08016.1 hypothetical protein BI350_11025 [Sporosarcina ureilytica]
MNIEYQVVDESILGTSQQRILRRGVPLQKFLQLDSLFTKSFIPREIDHIVIQRASVIEVKDFKTWILGGELALTTLENFCTIEQQLSLVNQLVKGGASCLAFHPGNNASQEVPIFGETLIYAEESKFPIVLLHAHVTYSDMIETVFKLELMSKEEDIGVSSEINQVLFQFLSQHVNLEQMIERVSNTISSEIILFDVDMTPHASSHDVKDSQVLKTLHSREFRQFINQQNLIKLFMNDNTLHIKISTSEHRLDVILAPINHNYYLKSILCVVGMPNQVLIGKVLNDTVNALKLEKEKTKKINFKLMDRANRALLFDQNKKEASKAFAHLRVTFDEQAAVLLMSMVDNQFTTPKQYETEFSNNLKSRILKYIVTELPKESTALWLKDMLIIYLSQVTPQTRLAVARKVEENISYYFPTVSVTFGLSSKSTTNVIYAYHEAVQAVEEGKRQGKTLTQFDNIGFTKVFTNVTNDYYIKQFYEHTLNPILSLEPVRQHDLLSTLESFMNNNMNYKETADDLFLHPNTVRYRVQQLKKIFQDEAIFEKADTIFELQFALRLLHRNSL